MDTEQKLRDNIMSELRKLTATNSPALFKMIQTADGYKQLEKTIIEKVINDNMPPIAVIPQLESDYGIAQYE